MKFLLLAILSTNVWADLAPKPGFSWDSVSKLAIQDRGRFKPLETFAVESVLFITGKRSWKGMSANEVLWSWIAASDSEWQNEKFVRVDYKPLKKELGLDPENNYYSPTELHKIPNYQTLFTQIMKKESEKEQLTEVEKKFQEMHQKIGLWDGIVSAEVLNIIPNRTNLDSPWHSLASISKGQEASGLTQEESVKLSGLMDTVLRAYISGNSALWVDMTQQVSSFLRSLGPYPSDYKLDIEVTFERLRPFRWAWILYIITSLALVAGSLTGIKLLSNVGVGTAVIAVGMHSYGFILRCIIAGRPPVTNMYESVVWVTWGCMVFGFLIWMVYKNTPALASASVFAWVGLILADTLPTILDPGIHPLEPVLRSNFWLTIHVLTITLSYAAFALSLCIGNVVLGWYLFKPSKIPAIQQYTLYMYRAVQIGVILLAAGTILGGVWAAYSWGRFWGWDPKEVWALVALLLYLAVLHGRFAGWLKGFGFVACMVVCFLGILMAWYGVNFVLGAGLHSYGFGTGGMGYVMGYVLLQLGFIGAAYWRYEQAKKQGLAPKSSAIFPK